MRVLLVSMLTMSLLLLAGCGGDDQKTQTQKSDGLTAEMDDEALVNEAASKLIAEFSQSLKGELIAALAEGGAIGAINVCQKVAPTIADSFSVEGWSIKRVSDRNRNPDNRATVDEKAILAAFDDTLAAATFYSEWLTDDSLTVFKYYQPIRVQPLCLKCHGNMQTLGPGVFDAVKKHYPTDKATGYNTGDLRGMFVVEVNWPEGREHAEQLVSDSL